MSYHISYDAIACFTDSLFPISQEPDGVSRACTKADFAASRLADAAAASAVVDAAAEYASDSSVASAVDKWHYVKA